MDDSEYRRRLIEVSLPLDAISTQSAREKSIRHGHISTLHIWWARRPLAAMRAAIFASLVPAPESDEERKKLEDLIATIVDWDQVKDGNSEAVLKARQMVLDAFGGRPPRVLDPFMGGGSTGLEALRLGCETHAVELNPVAHLIELCTLVYPQKYGQPARLPPPGADSSRQMVLPGQETPGPEQMALDLPLDGQEIRNPLAEDVRKWGQWVLERSREEIGHLYDDPVNGETVVGYLWARTARCPNPVCAAEMPLVRQWWLAKKSTKRIALRPLVDHRVNSVTFEVVEGKDIDFDPSQGTMRQGSVTCLFCGQTADSSYLQGEGKSDRLGQTLLAVVLEGANGKTYRQIAEADLRLFADAETRLDELLSQGAQFVPDELISREQPRIIWVILYGIEHWRQLFNPRQALALATLSRKVHEAYHLAQTDAREVDYARAISTSLMMIVDRMVDKASTLCIWNNIGEKIEHTFGRQALPMVWDYAEVNPFSNSTGNWDGASDWVVRSIEHCSSASNESAVVHQGTATRLTYPDDHFDAIITDPPYYDSIPYSHLADFFYVWLKRPLQDLYPGIFRTPLTPKGPEIVEQRPHRSLKARKDKEFYESELTKAFTEACRVLKSDGIFVVVFAHKSTTAWETLITSLLESGFVVTASWPLHTERPGRLIAQNRAALASSIFIVCRVRIAETEGYFDDVREELARTVRERLDFFWKQGIRGADFFISAIGPAVSVFGQYKQVYRLDGTPVGVGTLLDLVQETVADYALDRILNGHHRIGYVDPATRYYILYRWAYGANRIPFDDAMRMAMALGAEVDSLMDRRGVLQQQGENVTLRGPRERAGIQDLGIADRSGRQAPLIDILHQALLLWEKGDRDALAEFLGEAAFGREDHVRIVAQTLADVLPEDDRERRLLEGFLAGQEGLPGVARQERLL